MAPCQNNILQPIFRNLPAESRYQIYDYLIFDQENPRCPVTNGIAARYHGLPSLCYVNEALRIDVGLHYLRSTFFELKANPAALAHFEDFLKSFPDGQGFSAVRNLQFAEVKYGYCNVLQNKDGYDAFLRILPRCTEVTKVRLELSEGAFKDPERRPVSDAQGQRWWLEVELTAEEVIERYSLKSYVQNQLLDTLCLEGPSSISLRPGAIYKPTLGRVAYGRVILDRRALLDEIADILRREWRQRGRSLTVILQHSPFWEPEDIYD